MEYYFLYIIQTWSQTNIRIAGEPSVCVHHQGDGLCEDFERRSVLSDCGYFTPDGATDQWTIDAHANPEHDMTSCPASAVVGQPAYDVAKVWILLVNLFLLSNKAFCCSF